MPDDMTPQPAPRALRPVNAGEPLTPPPREIVSLEIAKPSKDDESPAERTFETKATRIRLTEEEHQDLAMRLGTIPPALPPGRGGRGPGAWGKRPPGPAGPGGWGPPPSPARASLSPPPAPGCKSAPASRWTWRP